MMALRLEDHVFRMLENQARLFEFLGEHRWDFDMDAGRLVFTSQDPGGGEGRVLHEAPVQLLGSESAADRTWLWAWANERSGIPGRLLEGINRVKAAAAEEDRPLFLRADEVPLEYDEFGVELAIISAGALGAFAYYACAHPGGTLYAAIPEAPEGLSSSQARDAGAVVRTLGMGIAALHFEHRPAVLAYLGAPLVENDEGCGWDLGGRRVMIKFDELGRITRMATQLGGAP